MLQAHSSSSNIKIASELLTQLTGYIQRSLEYQPRQHQAIRTLIDAGSQTSAFGHNYGLGRSSLWLPFDLFMEDAMDGRQVPATSAIETLAELTKSLQAAYGTSWQETFLGLWTASLRLVERERDPVEGPIPHLDSRLCILLSITPLVVVSVIEEEERSLQAADDNSLGNTGNADNHDKQKNLSGQGTRRAALHSSLKILGQFDGLLVPPQSVASMANQAAIKAVSLLGSITSGNGTHDGLSSSGISRNAVGNMQHLIVEACIARKLIDSSTYLWPGYVGGLINPLSHSIPVQRSPWSAFMEGSPLSISLRNALITTPASSLGELEKIYHIAINGSEEERSAAASILCGASLIRGWNVQEHTVRLVVKLLSPPVPADYHGHGPRSHLVASAPLLHAVLKGITTVDTVHVLSLHGMIPEVAAALMPICEVFGSILPTGIQSSNKGEEVLVYTIFSNAFILLLRLWKFYGCPHEHSLSGKGAPVGSELSLEYLLLLYNMRVASSVNMDFNRNMKDKEHFQANNMSGLGSLPEASNPSKDQTLESALSAPQQVLIDSFPNLKVWYCQHQACIASTLSGFVRGNPVHQLADRLLNMMYWKMNKGVSTSSAAGTSANGSISSSSASAGEDASRRPMLPAWEILGAVPFVVDAMLTACAHGRLSPRDLTTGLRDLVEFLPASVATVVSYFSAEVTRGIWKPASMNGTDWPSPAANLLSVEAEVKETLAATGIDVPSLVTGNTAATLPLPLAALVSLTITFKMDKNSEFLNGIAGSALETAAAGSPWPSTPIVAALWAQKVRRWHAFIIFTSARTVFRQDKYAVSQLLRSCFAAALGSINTIMPRLTVHGGVGALLGRCFRSHSSPGGTSPVAPGLVYLRVYRGMYDIRFVTEEILTLVVETARGLAATGMNGEYSGQSTKNAQRLKSHQVSLANALARVKQASSLGASLLCITGGSGLVQMLYQEILPTWFLSGNGTKPKFAGSASALEGYAIAYFSFLCGACSWGVNASSFSKRRAQVVGIHMDFMARAMEGKISLGCEHATWRAYVLGFLAMIVSCVPNWISEVNLETLKRLATGLRWWHEPELSIALLERGGLRAMSAAADLV
eukprot:PITA_21926